ncbi:hypothetical protein ABPG75_008004 [Micractinium tetrahymenae]
MQSQLVCLPAPLLPCSALPRRRRPCPAFPCDVIPPCLPSPFEPLAPSPPPPPPNPPGERCYYYHDEWWTYELCYRKHVRQYHKTAEGQLEGEYLLGVYDELEQQEDEDTVQVDTADVSGGMRYVSQLYVGGETCEPTEEPRQAEVRFTCATDGGGTRLAAVKEPSSCRYILTVATPRLCKHPAFQEQPVSAALIRCHPLPEEEEAGGVAAGQCGAAAAGGFAAAAAAADGGVLADNATHDAAEGEVTGETDDGLLTSLVEGEAEGYYTEEDDDDLVA